MKKIPEAILHATAEAHKLAERSGLPVFVCECKELNGPTFYGCRFNEHEHAAGEWFKADRFTDCRVLKVIQHPDNCQTIPHIA